MRLKSSFIFFLFLIVLTGCSTGKKTDQEQYLCSKVIVHSEHEFELTETEKKLICGDVHSEAYQVIPSYQASFLLTGYLQAKGFTNPRFDYVKDLLHVYPGEVTYFKEVVVNSAFDHINKDLEEDLRRYFKRDVITPSILSEMESVSKTYLREYTYPCAEVKSIFDVSTGTVKIEITGLTAFNFGPIKKEEVPSLSPTAFDRFYPFKSSQPFDERKLILTEKRFLREGVVQGTYFHESCNLKKEEFSLSQNYILGTNRTIRFGVGATTEVGPMVRVKWSNQRDGRMASLLESSLQLSFRNQYASIMGNRFLWEENPRTSLRMSLELERDNQILYEELSSTFRPHLELTRDSRDRHWLWGLGPTLIASTYRNNSSDSNTRKIATGAIEGAVQIKSHDYEAYDVHPESGDMTSFSFDFRHPSFGFVDPLLKLNFTTLKLLEVGEIGKGRGIVGLRLNTATTIVPDRTDLNELPPSVKFYGGGSDDVRGFKLNRLPNNNGEGALTKLNFKVEFRKTHFFVSKVESFTFVDTVLFGQKPWEVDDQLWYSPGTGIRWLSPIGIVQGYVARSLSTKGTRDDGNFYFLGLGGVF